jgi:hypothetical protein
MEHDDASTRSYDADDESDGDDDDGAPPNFGNHLLTGAVLHQALQHDAVHMEEEHMEEEQEANPPFDIDSFEWVLHGANQSATLHLVPKNWGQREGSTKIEKMYDSTHQVSEKRSYKDDRETQALRWLSTVVFAKPELKAGMEIQAYFDKETKTILISSNKNTVNAKLAEYLATPGAIASLRDFMSPGREDRHFQKLVGKEDVYAEQDEIVTAILTGQFRVPPALPKARGDLHAERRIHEYLQTLDPDRAMDDKTKGHLGGVKRPCAACTVALNLVGKARSGPIWPSTAGLGGLASDAIQQTFMNGSQLTYVTQPRDGGKPTTGHNTDSDSD